MLIVSWLVIMRSLFGAWHKMNWVMMTCSRNCNFPRKQIIFFWTKIETQYAWKIVFIGTLRNDTRDYSVWFYHCWLPVVKCEGGWGCCFSMWNNCCVSEARHGALVLTELDCRVLGVKTTYSWVSLNLSYAKPNILRKFGRNCEVSSSLEITH